MKKSRIKKQIHSKYRKIKALTAHLHLRKFEIAVLMVILVEFLFPQISLAQELQPISYQANDSLMYETVLLSSPEPKVIIAANVSAKKFTSSLPVAGDKEPVRVMWVTVTAYSSTPDQTDDTPCITANGFNVCEHDTENVIAANFLSFGTNVKLPEVFGDRVLTVQDRMNPRYHSRVDVWMESRQAAREFGIKRLQIEIY